MKLPPNIPAPIFDLSAIIIGFLLIDESTPAEQNSIGNWFMLIGQVLCTNSAQQQVINNRSNKSNTSNQHVINDTFGSDFANRSDTNAQIQMIERIVKAMEQELNNLKNNL